MKKSLIAAGIATAVLIAGCGSDDMATMGHGSSSAAPTSAAGGQNAQDVTFAQAMVVHHAQAVDMAKLVPTRSTNAKVLDLAKRVEAAQAPEIDQLNGWLKAWNATSTSMPGMDHGSMSDGSMPGMMSADDMGKLAQVTGTEFDRMWLDMMIRHHEGAVEMSKTELAKGGNADAKELAKTIVDAQQQEIAEMRELLKA
ncbi:MAG: DUF305 domain-containing protein [Umezawaea sp.]